MLLTHEHKNTHALTHANINKNALRFLLVYFKDNKQNNNKVKLCAVPKNEQHVTNKTKNK